MTDTTDCESTDEPVACTITDETRADRERFVRTELAPYVEAVERRDPAGWRFVVDDGGLEGATEFARHEHECCAFATFEVTVTPGDADDLLAVHGPDGTEDMFRGLVDTLVAEFDVELRT
jgi:hypothetical protein